MLALRKQFANLCRFDNKISYKKPIIPKHTPIANHIKGVFAIRQSAISHLVKHGIYEACILLQMNFPSVKPTSCLHTQTESNDLSNYIPLVPFINILLLI